MREHECVYVSASAAAGLCRMLLIGIRLPITLMPPRNVSTSDCSSATLLRDMPCHMRCTLPPPMPCSWGPRYGVHEPIDRSSAKRVGSGVKCMGSSAGHVHEPIEFTLYPCTGGPLP